MEPTIHLTHLLAYAFIAGIRRSKCGKYLDSSDPDRLTTKPEEVTCSDCGTKR